jgi:hypothetical protein
LPPKRQDHHRVDHAYEVSGGDLSPAPREQVGDEVGTGEVAGHPATELVPGQQ